MTNETQPVHVTYTHLKREDATVSISLSEYRDWLGLEEGEDFEFEESEVISFLNAGDPVYEVTGYIDLEDFTIESVDCGI
jgi:hypothetical protein